MDLANHIWNFAKVNSFVVQMNFVNKQVLLLFYFTALMEVSRIRYYVHVNDSV